MAATAVYVSLKRVPLSAPLIVDDVTYSNISATTAAFTLAGGRYAIAVKASTYGSVTLQVLGPDAATYLTAATAIVADGCALIDAPPGTYKILVA